MKRLTVEMFTPAGKNWSNAQDLPPGSCPARASELLQKVDSFVTLSHPCPIWERQGGAEGGMDGGMVQGPASFLSLLWQHHHPATTPLLHRAVLFLAEVSRLGPFGI